jgi:hypothetical protein
MVASQNKTPRYYRFKLTNQVKNADKSTLRGTTFSRRVKANLKKYRLFGTSRTKTGLGLSKTSLTLNRDRASNQQFRAKRTVRQNVKSFPVHGN